MAEVDASLPEKAARRISPLFFLAAVGCFFLAFAGVSCNTSAAKTLIGGAGQALGGNQAQTQQARACLDALNGYNLATYSGTDLAFGNAPTAASSAPAACTQASGGSFSPSGSGNPAQGKLGMQPFELIGLIVIAVGALLSIVFFVRSPRARIRAVITSLLAAAGVALVVVAQFQAAKAVTDKIAASSSGASSSLPISINVSDYVNVNPAIGLYLVVGVLGVVVLLNLLAAAAPPPPRSDSVGPMSEQPPTGPGVTPEERPDLERQQPQPGTEAPTPIPPPIRPGTWPGAPDQGGTPPGAPEPPAPHVPG